MALYLNVSTNKVYVDNGLTFSVPYAPGQVFEADPSLPTVQAMLKANPPPIIPYSLPAVSILDANNIVKNTSLPAGVSKTFTGLAAPGAVTLAGATVGQRVVAIWDTAGAVAAAQADFESTISVAGQIQQIGGGDLHLSKFDVLLV